MHGSGLVVAPHLIASPPVDVGLPSPFTHIARARRAHNRARDVRAPLRDTTLQADHTLKITTPLDYMGGGAWPFLVGAVICLVNSVNERDPRLLNRYK